MTTARIIEPGIVKVNGRTHYFERIASLAKVGSAKWVGATVSGATFRIEGGRKAGGSKSDWFLDIEVRYLSSPGSIYCTSMMDALRCINNA